VEKRAKPHPLKNSHFFLLYFPSSFLILTPLPPFFLKSSPSLWEEDIGGGGKVPPQLTPSLCSSLLKRGKKLRGKEGGIQGGEK